MVSDADDNGNANAKTVKPQPDPTVLTTEALERGLKAERDYAEGQRGVLHERLHGIDRATEVLHESVTKGPTETQKAVAHLRELMDAKLDLVDVKFGATDQRFTERDVRSERESRDNKTAVDAAFAAQKEAAAEQNKSNTLAISKSETATAETIKTLSESFQSSVRASDDKIADLKERLSRVESGLNGSKETVTTQRLDLTSARQGSQLVVAMGGLAVAFLFGAAGIILTIILR